MRYHCERRKQDTKKYNTIFFCKTLATLASVYMYRIKCIYRQICMFDYDYG